MKTRKNFFVVSIIVLCCLFLVWLCSTIQGGQRTYEVQPHITVPEYRTDAARAIDAYERLMDRYMDLTERNLFKVGDDVRDVVRRLDCIDEKLSEIRTRIARIEKALGIEQSQPPGEDSTEVETFNKELEADL